MAAMCLFWYPTWLPQQQFINASTQHRLLETKETRYSTQYQDNGHSFVWFYCIKRAFILFLLFNSTNFVVFLGQFKMAANWIFFCRHANTVDKLFQCGSRFFVLAQQYCHRDVTCVALFRYRFRKTKDPKFIKNPKIKSWTKLQTIDSLLCLCIEFALFFSLFLGWPLLFGPLWHHSSFGTGFVLMLIRLPGLAQWA